MPSLYGYSKCALVRSGTQMLEIKLPKNATLIRGQWTKCLSYAWKIDRSFIALQNYGDAYFIYSGKPLIASADCRDLDDALIALRQSQTGEYGHVIEKISLSSDEALEKQSQLPAVCLCSDSCTRRTKLQQKQWAKEHMSVRRTNGSTSSQMRANWFFGLDHYY